MEEQASFLAAAEMGSNYEQYALILETGLRTGELIGLTWGDIDWEKRTLTVNKTLEYRYSTGEWSAGPPKTEHGYRTICLTSKAYQLLRGLYDGRTHRKCTSNMILTFLDPRTERIVPVKMSELVFLNPKTGEPTKNSSYDTHIRKICDKIGMNYFSMHSLRHTFATRAIEYGVQPKVLQKILGHASLKITMDRYVHVSDDSLQDAMETFERHSGESAGVNTCENGVEMA